MKNERKYVDRYEPVRRKLADDRLTTRLARILGRPLTEAKEREERLGRELYETEMVVHDLRDEIVHLLGELDCALVQMSLREFTGERPSVRIYAYLADQAYGGPEEGGWYYTTEQVLKVLDGWYPIDVAQKWICRANQLTRGMVNSRRRPPSSVISEGHVYWGMTLLDEPRDKPYQRPRYE